MKTLIKLLRHLYSTLIAGFGLITKQTSAGGVILILAFCLSASESYASTIADWRFEPGNMGADSSGNGNDLTLNNVISTNDIAPTAPSGTGSAVFDGTDSYAVTTGNLDLSQSKTLTIECFAKTSQSSVGMVYVDTADENKNLGGFYFDFNEKAGDVKTSQSQNKVGSNYSTDLAPYPKDGNWHHYALTIDETGPQVVFQIYIDGVLATNTSSISSVQDFPIAPFYIGAFGGASDFFNGQLGEVRISNRILPPSGFLIASSLTNASILITQQPTNTTVLQSRDAVFTVGATLQNGDQRLLDYQWQTNGVNLPGATAATCTLPPALLGYQGMNVDVVVSVPSVGGVTPVVSSNAVLDVTPDTVPPMATSAYALANTMISVHFDELLDPVSSSNAANYSLDGGATVQSAQLQSDGQTVVLGVSTLSNSVYNLSYNNVADLASNYASDSINVTNAGFTLADIGTVPTPSMVISANAASATVIGGEGGDVSGAADGFNYIYTNISGDFDVRLQIDNVDNYANNTSTRGGLMVREDTTSGSRNMFIGTYAPWPVNDWFCTVRSTAGGATVTDQGKIIPRGVGFQFPNAWVRLTRAGQTFTAYYSTNDLDWTQYGTNMTPNPAYPSNVLIGIASDSVSKTQTATFQYGPLTEFSLTSGNIAITSQPTNASVIAYHGPAIFTVAAVLQPTNHPELLAYQWLTNGVEVSGANSTNFSIPSIDLSPDSSGMQVRCAVSALGAAPIASSNATLTITADTNPPVALYAYSVDGSTIGIGFNELLDPATATDSSRYTIGGGVSINQVTLNADGQSVLVSTSGGLSAPTFSVAFTNIADLSGNLASGTITGSSAGLTMQDIGEIAGAGSILDVSPSGFTVSANGSDINHTDDSFNFIYKPLTNDFDVRLQLDDIPVATSTSTRGGLMARLDTTAGSPNVFVGTYGPSGDNHWLVTERSTQEGATSVPAYVTRPPGFAFPNAWFRLQRSGQTITAFDSTDGFTWTPLAVVTNISLPDVLLVGIASTSVNNFSASQFQYSNFGTTISLPQLQITETNGTALISWPVDAVGFQLQQSSQLGADTIWTTVTNVPIQVTANLQVTVPLASHAQFYRLEH